LLLWQLAIRSRNIYMMLAHFRGLLSKTFSDEEAALRAQYGPIPVGPEAAAAAQAAMEAAAKA
jgi:hypothetical protein